MPEPSPYLTASEVAEVLRMSPIAVIRLCRTGSIPATKPSGKWLIHREELDSYIAAGRNDGEREAS